MRNEGGIPSKEKDCDGICDMAICCFTRLLNCCHHGSSLSIIHAVIDSSFLSDIISHAFSCKQTGCLRLFVHCCWVRDVSSPVLFPLSAPISPPFSQLICIILFFTRRPYFGGKKDDRSRSSMILVWKLSPVVC